MSKVTRMFSNLNKTSSFTRWMTPDDKVPTVESVKNTDKRILRGARPVNGSFTWVMPAEQPETKLIGVSPACMKDLGLEEGYEKTDEFQKIVSGQQVVEDVHPWAQNYAGWQFGQWAGQLGDGRAISLFDVTNNNGKRYELQLKGAGLTPYSRFADGKAVIRSSVREMLGSEAANALGIPTTRALALSRYPQTKARRERTEECAVLCRVSESWIRIGTFDLHQSKGDRKEARKLADYCIEELFNIEKDGKRYDNLYREICLRNAYGMAHWQAYGLLNGVLNTDNTSVLGLFIDYGPFAFMDTFDSNFTPNHSDPGMRYAFKNVPTAVWWNLVRLGEDLGELIGAGEDLVNDPTFLNEGVKKEQVDGVLKRAEDFIQNMQKEFHEKFVKEYTQLMMKRLGLQQVYDTDHDEILSPLLDMLEQCQLDYNLFLRRLGDFKLGQDDIGIFFPEKRGFIIELSLDDAKKELNSWLDKFRTRCEQEGISDEARQTQSRKVNPKFILKNWILDDVIRSVQNGETELFNQVMHMSLNPFNESWGFEVDEKYTQEGLQGDRDIQCSCSS